MRNIYIYNRTCVLLHHHFPLVGCLEQIMSGLYVIGLQKRLVCFTIPDIISTEINFQQCIRVTLGLRWSIVHCSWEA